ncbi:MAG: FHA domain-containing protein [Verrucomicrobiales bacterium]
MAARLTIQHPEADPNEVWIGNTASIGRTRDNQVYLPFSKQVSRQHALLRCQSGFQYQILDLGSRNGTFLNQQRVILPSHLRDGDQIVIGDVNMCFHQDSSSAEETAGRTIAFGHLTGHELTQRVALLLCDVQGFTRNSEALAAPLVSQTLGGWYRDVAEIISSTQGVVDKFVGDAVLAYWSSSRSPGLCCHAAWTTAKEILLRAQSRRWPERNEPFRVRIALHFGPVTSGNIGVSAERDATIIGDPVNTLFKIETVMKSLGHDLVMSDAVLNQLGSERDFLDLGEVTLPGKEGSTRLFAPLQAASSTETNDPH